MDRKILENILNNVPVREVIMSASMKSIKEGKINVAKMEKELRKCIEDYMTSEGFDAKEVWEYAHVKCTKESDGIRVDVGAELSYDGCYDLSEKLNKVITRYDKNAYFDMEAPGLMTAFIEEV